MLAYMSACDRDALVCDFAQFYHLDIDEQPVGRAAVLACGLPADCRIYGIIRKEKERQRHEEAEIKRRQRTVTDNSEVIYGSSEAFMEARAAIMKG